MRGGKPIAMSYRTPEAVKYRNDFAKYVAYEVRKQKWDLVPNKTQHFYIDTVFYFPSTNLDGNNYFKVMLDAITDTGLIWLDDNVACERIQAIYYDSANPRVELTISPVDYIGIFDNESQMEKFESVCIECNRYTRNCSILRKAKEGRIQDEIQDGYCLKFRKKKITKR